MLMLVTGTEDGARFQFFADEASLTAQFGEDEPAPSRWLTWDEAATDHNYWPEDSAFLAEVKPMQMQPEQVAVSWKVATL
jgi:hypothetical protein